MYIYVLISRSFGTSISVFCVCRYHTQHSLYNFGKTQNVGTVKVVYVPITVFLQP
jgi:hypothetical protein